MFIIKEFFFMSVPAKKRSKSKVRRARAHKNLKPSNLIPCPECKTPKNRHTACSNCGKYKSREVIDVAKKTNKKLSEHKH